MNREPIHKNLSTAFVDLEALVNHLKDLQFVGSVHVELSSYEAEIVFSALHTIHIREFDHSAGGPKYGTKALERIFERAREPFGRIHVYRSISIADTDRDKDVYVDQAISSRARQSLSGLNDTPAYHLIKVKRETADPEFLGLISELLQTLQTSCQNAELNFPEAFRNTCSNLSALHPFLHPQFGAVTFTINGVKLDVRVEKRRFIDAVVEVISIVIARVAELTSRSCAIDRLQKDLHAFAKRRHKELDRQGLNRLSEMLLDEI